MDEQLLQQWRKDTPGTTQRLHFNNAGAALMPKPVLEAVRAHFSLENQIGGYEAAAMQSESLVQFYTELAAMLHTEERNIAHATSATDAYNRALTSIPFEAGDIVLTTEDDYVSNQIAFLSLKKRFGVDLHWCKTTEEGGYDLEDMEQKIKSLHPKLVAVTHIPTNSGLIQDVAAVGQLCREHGIWYLVDACQSAGQMALDVNAIGCDFLTATFRKFLRGPRGIGFLYVSDRVLEAGLEPLFPDLHGARWTANEEYQNVDDAKRFEVWERSYALVSGAREAVRYAQSIGWDTIQDRIQHLSQHLRNLLQEIPGARVLDQGKDLGGIVTADFQQAPDPQEFMEALRRKRLNTSIAYQAYARFDLGRKNADWVLRLSPHYYNTEAEAQKAVNIIQQVITGS